VHRDPAARFHVIWGLPWSIERALLLLGGVWFVNLVNFMDGIDWMTVAEVVPVTAGVALLGAIGAAPPLAMLVALALLGAIIGFAPFNRPVARLFLGDVGSLPIGLLLGWLMLLLAGRGHSRPRCCCRSIISPTRR
jgi:UDP-N-acetylmuramyl pentapeptide phosphotransferase/UDP-N-acetylglucosamine-1-phosphate transferase